MIVVFEVTVHAVTGCVHKLLRLVTILAVNICVFAQQRKRCQVMIEKRRVGPLGFGMTTTALLTQLAFMRIIFEVTRHAIGSG